MYELYKNMKIWIGFLPSLDTLDRPPAIDCRSCKVDDWTIEDGGTMVLKLELCALHKTGIFAITDQTIRPNRQ